MSNRSKEEELCYIVASKKRSIMKNRIDFLSELPSNILSTIESFFKRRKNFMDRMRSEHNKQALEYLSTNKALFR